MPVSRRHPDWLRIKAPDPALLSRVEHLLRGLGLHTVCEEANCPNLGECFGHGVATFMILGDTCSRNCTFCAVNHGRPSKPDPEEPERVARAARKLGLKYVVVTSVTRDDLDDGGAAHFVTTIEALRRCDPDVGIEVLIPDFGGSLSALKTVMATPLSVFNHNVETVPRLYPQVRPQARYERSIELLDRAKTLAPSVFTKSGLMLGLGEEKEEVLRVMADLREVNCDLLTIGQYLRPSANHYPMARYLTPEEFGEYKRIGEELGFKAVASAPLVRSSFHAAEIFGEGRHEE